MEQYYVQCRNSSNATTSKESKFRKEKLTSLEFRSRKRAHVPEEALIQQLKKLERSVVDRSTRAARVHQRDVDDARIMITRIFSEKERVRFTRLYCVSD